MKAVIYLIKYLVDNQYFTSSRFYDYVNPDKLDGMDAKSNKVIQSYVDGLGIENLLNKMNLDDWQNYNNSIVESIDKNIFDWHKIKWGVDND